MLVDFKKFSLVFVWICTAEPLFAGNSNLDDDDKRWYRKAIRELKQCMIGESPSKREWDPVYAQKEASETHDMIHYWGLGCIKKKHRIPKLQKPPICSIRTFFDYSLKKKENIEK